MNTLRSRYESVQARIEEAARAATRDPASIELLAVSKRHPPQAIRDLYALGQRRFGENYVDEALEKMATLDDLDLHWHYIGPIQSNKTRAIAEHFDRCESVDRWKVARRLSEQRPEALDDLEVLVQVHIGDEATKSGCDVAEVPDLARAVAELDRLRLRGLMCIPPPSDDPAVQRAHFAELRRLFETLGADGLELDILSMGMTDDLASAIAEGSTELRIGTAIFGPRPAAQP